MIGIICAMEVEAKRFKALMSDINKETISGTDFFCGKLWGRETVLAISGIGKVNAAMCAQTMILKFSPDFIINSGVAGGLEPSLKICDIVIAKNVVQHDMDTSPVGDPVGFISGINLIEIPCDEKLASMLKKSADTVGINCINGTIASGDQFINSNEKRKYISDTFGAYACEMESGSIGHVCYKNDVPFCAIRSISDNADDSSHLSYNKFVEITADNLINVMEGFYSNL